HFQAFGGETQDAAVGEEAAGVIYHNRRLADHAHVIQRGGERDVAGVLADDDFHQHHLLDRREEMDADELALVLELFRQRIDRQGRGVGGKDRVALQQRLRLGIGFGLYFPVLEYGFDDQIAILQGIVVGGRRYARQDGVAVGFLGAAL